MSADLLKRRTTKFTLWAPGQTAPKLVIGTFQFGAPPTFATPRTFDLKAVAGLDGLWEIAPSDCGLVDQTVYHYWFEVDDTAPGSAAGSRVRVTDPATTTPDWRLTEGVQPASVIQFAGGQLVACDEDGTAVKVPAIDNPGGLAANNFMVIYELPTAWTRQPRGLAERGVGTFRDIVAMLDKNAQAANFDELEAAQQGHAHIAELGINAIELLPPADSYYERQWGYGTSHLFAPDSELGQPEYNSWSTSNADLRKLAETCHGLNIRLISDVVMAFAQSGPYERAAFTDFHVDIPDNKPPDPNDPDVWSSRFGVARNAFGSTLWRYVRQATTYDPVSGTKGTIVPARQLQFVGQERWMTDFQIDGFRIDSVENVANWDFLGTFTSSARDLFRSRCAAHGVSQNDADARFMVVGEELSLPLDIIRQKRLTALWNDNFREYVRCAVLGQAASNETFLSTVGKMVNCLAFGFGDMAEAVNYIGSHDVEGEHKERIATMFRYQFPNDDLAIGRRVKLAFACLLTAVGMPMILAGDEFADENDLFNIHGNVSNDSGKQIDPVNFSRLEGDGNAWRRDVLGAVKNLIQNRKTHPALGVNDVKIIHSDISADRRIVAWQRGSDDNPVVVVANFSDFGTDDPLNPAAEYVVANWPRASDFAWKEVSLNRNVAAGKAGRESLFPWEAKVYIHQ